MMARNMKMLPFTTNKILHMFCGGLIGMMAPSILSEPIYALYAILFTIITYIPYYTGHLLYWVQLATTKMMLIFVSWLVIRISDLDYWRPLPSNYTCYSWRLVTE